MANSYLTYTPNSAVTLGTKATISFWVKRSKVDGSNTFQGILASNGGWNDGTGFAIGWYADELYWYNLKDGNGYRTYPANLRKFRDINSWYHILYQIDTTQSAVQDRITLYVNGEDQGDFATNTGSGISYAVPAQNAAPYQFFDNGDEHTIGRWGSAGAGAQNHFDGYLSHFAYVDGSVVAPTVFGQTDSTTGIWKFKGPSGVTWGNNGFHLKFENSGALGTDSSGNSNTFAVNGDLKQSISTPSNVYATLDELARVNNFDQRYVEHIHGNNTAQGTSTTNNGNSYSTIGVDKGKWYCEAKINGVYNTIYPTVGFIVEDNATNSSTTQIGYTASGTGGYKPDGQKLIGGSGSSYGDSFTNGDIIGMALDLDNGAIYFSKNGVYQDSGDPTSGASKTGAAFSFTPDGSFYFLGTSPYRSQSSVSFNFGTGFFGTTAITSAGSNGNGSLFEYDVPNGYYALNTKNLNTYG